MYLFGDPLNRQTFLGSFVVSSWGSNESEGEKFSDLELKGNRTRENELQQALVKVYLNSELKSCFVSADILALDRYVNFYFLLDTRLLAFVISSH